MLSMRFTRYALSAAVLAATIAGPNAHAAAQEQHGRKWQPPPPTAPITITVVKGFNNKPFENAGVVFRAVKDSKTNGTLEVKTNPDGNAKIDVLEVGSRRARPGHRQRLRHDGRRVRPHRRGQRTHPETRTAQGQVPSTWTTTASPRRHTPVCRSASSPKPPRNPHPSRNNLGINLFDVARKAPRLRASLFSGLPSTPIRYRLSDKSRRIFLDSKVPS